MNIEQSLERIANALEQLVAGHLGNSGEAPAVEPPKKSRAKKAQAPVEDAVPGFEEAPPAEVVEASPTVTTGADLRNLAQGLIQSADASDPGGKSGTVNKLVTFIQSVAKIYNPGEPKLIKIPEAKIPEAATMITNWCAKNGIGV